MKMLLLFVLAAIAMIYEVKGEKNEVNQWALLAAGSNMWMNYRHQADVSHAYQILIKRGIPESNIIVMMYDDIANNPSNPKPGKIFNKPNGPDVYKGVKIDYKGDDVNSVNFLAVMSGNSNAIKGIGSGRTIQSGENDHVFINFVDHGSTGIFGFPKDFLTAAKLNSALSDMFAAKKYGKMLIYMEACHSGSMFSGILPDNTKIFATTAANAVQYSLACYCSWEGFPCLGDVYSINWMNHMDKKIPNNETVLDQFQIVKTLTTTSEVSKYGDESLGSIPVSEFLGYKNELGEIDSKLTDVTEGAVPSQDAALHFLRRMARRGHNRSIDIDYAALASDIQAKRDFISVITSTIIKHVSDDMSYVIDILTSDKVHFTQESLLCHDRLIHLFNDICFDVAQNPYAARFSSVLANACEMGEYYENRADSAIKSVCRNIPYIRGAE